MHQKEVKLPLLAGVYCKPCNKFPCIIHEGVNTDTEKKELINTADNISLLKKRFWLLNNQLSFIFKSLTVIAGERGI